MDKVLKAASVIGINEVEDEVFDEIDRTAIIKKIHVYVMQCNLYCALFGCLFATFGLVAHLGYENRSHLVYLGLISVLHVISFVIGLIGVQKRRRHALTAMGLMNAAWLALVTLLIIYCLFMIKNKQVKEEFNNEIIFHVGLLVYYPLALACAACHLMLVYTLVAVKKKRIATEERSVSTSTYSTSGSSKPSETSESTKRKSTESLRNKDKKQKL